MDIALILASIGRTVATVLLGGDIGGDKVREWAGYLNLASTIAGTVGIGSADVQLLDDQLKAAAAEGRGLLPAEREAWRARSDAASAALEAAAGP